MLSKVIRVTLPPASRISRSAQLGVARQHHRADNFFQHVILGG